MYPSQPPCALNGKPCPDFVAPDPTIYNSNTPFPVATTTIANDASPFGYHVVTINICPFEYLPLQKKLFRYDQINITINYTIGQVEYQARISERRNQITKDYVRGMVQNPLAISNNSKTANQIVHSPATSTNSEKLTIPWKPSLYGSVPEYIIITNNALKPTFETLARYKTQKGIPTLLVTVEQIYQNFAGIDNAEKVRNYLKSAHQFWGAGLFVLLGGDTAVVPARKGLYAFGAYHYTDFYYCDLYKAGDPNYNWNSNNDSVFGVNGDVFERGADNFIGRAPVDNTIEVANFINKIIKYEKLEGVVNTNYVNNMLFLGAYAFYNHPQYGYDNLGQRWHNLLNNEPFLSISIFKKHLLYDDYLGSTFNSSLGNEELNKNTTLNRINNGLSNSGKFHLISHLDHGSPFGIGVSGGMKGDDIDREDMDNLTNGNDFQIMYTTACSPGDFELDCFAERYVNATNGGGVAILANSGSVPAWLNANQDVQFFKSIYGNLSPTSYIMGVAFANSRDAILSEQQKQLTLFGDPTMATWGATPQNISLTVQSSLTINNAIANVLPVTINALTNDAKVTLYKFNTLTNSAEVYASQTLVAGATTAQFTVNPDTTGVMTVTVTAHNYLPATANVNIILPQAHLYVTGYTFVDSNGNGFIEQGETINLSVNITNSGATSISLVNAVLACNPLFANITATTSTNALVNAGQTITLTGFVFTAQTANTLPDFIEFILNITANGGYVHADNFFLDLKNPVITMGARTLTNDFNTVLNSMVVNSNMNLKIKLKNIGNVSTGALTATLSSTIPSNILSFINPTSTYASLAVFEEQLNATPFVFKQLSAYTGAKPFTLTLTNALGKSWVFNFDMNEGLPPLITNFSFISISTEIKLIWNPVPNIQGYNIYRSNTIDGTYTKANNYLVSGSSTYTDYTVNPSTIYYYKISVVTLFGNERQLNQVVTTDTPPKQGYKAWTSLDAHGAFPISASGNNDCRTSPAVFDVDNDGKKEIFVNYQTNSNEGSGKIMGFKESGQEMFDIDGNPTTVSGFALTNIQMFSNSAVGDVDNDGHAEVFSTGRNNYTNEGKLYAFKTIDANNDNKPDKLWADEFIDFGLRVGRNPVLYDIDKNGFLDIIVANENQKVYVYDKNKNIMPGWPQQVPGVDYSLGEIAVADLDHDGKAEIALGCKAINGTKGGIYIWHHDGTPFTTNPFKEFADGECADGGIVFADIDNDLNLDLLCTTKFGSDGTTGKIYAFKQNGTPVNATWNGVNNLTMFHWYGVMPRIAVGDINHDGNLEIAVGSEGMLKVFDKFGVNLPNYPKTITSIFASAPILADIDSDNDSEIIINDNGKLIAFNFDGSACAGFPITASSGVQFANSPTIDDVDNDGKNEIVIATLDGSTFVYKTIGLSINNEWNAYRANAQNTGTYKEVCNNILDLMVKDGTEDLGAEPNTATQLMCVSNNIWARNNNDNELEHQNPEYSSNGVPNFIKVRVVNKSCIVSTGTEQLKLFWAKASTSLSWPSPWTGGVANPTTGANMGNEVGTLIIPVLQPGQEIIMTFPWQVPNPADYGADGNQWHFCLLSQIEASNDPLHNIEIDNLWGNVANNNNMAWTNLTVVDVLPNNVVNPGGVIAVGNPFDYPKTYYLEMQIADAETGKPIYEEAEVGIKMDDILYNAWVRGGKGTQLLDATLEEKRKIVKGNHVILDDISFNAKEIGTLKLNFNFLTKELTGKTNYIYNVLQKDAQTGKTIGGEAFIINKKARAPFVADAGDDKEVDLNQPITISAVDINEPAIYNWYDNDNNLVFQGKNLQIANAVAEKYKLEVISTVDGFKDYSEMEVKINPNRLKNIAPNPVVGTTKISYNLQNATSAYLMIVSYYMNGGVSNNYVLDVNSSETNINLSNYANGFYKVVLVVNGVISDAKIIFKQ